jgi:hypothetical protein
LRVIFDIGNDDDDNDNDNDDDDNDDDDAVDAHDAGDIKAVE